VQFILLGYLGESASAKILPKQRGNSSTSILVATETSTTEVEHNESHMVEEQANISQGMKMTFIFI
jgi:hypothetical protein